MAELTAHLKDPRLEKDKLFPGVCFAYSVEKKNGSDEYDVKLMFNDADRDRQRAGTPNQRTSIINKYQREPQILDYLKFTTYGFNHL